MQLYDHERIDALYSNDIQIIQSENVFSFSLDAVLLAQFPRIPKKGTIVDLCAGNGAVGLFASTKTKASIHSFEIQKRLADMAKRSVALNHLTQQVHIYPTDIKNALHYVKKDSCDLVYCNPPYFKHQPNKKKNPNPYLALARHELTTNLDEVTCIASQLLKTKGKFALVHRPDRFLDILDTLKKYHLAPKRIQFVYPKLGKKANILLIEAIKYGSCDGLTLLPPLIVYNEKNEYLEPIYSMLYTKEKKED